MPAALRKQRRGCTGEWANTLYSTCRQTGAADMLLWRLELCQQHGAQHSWMTEHSPRVGVGGLKEGEGGGSSLKSGTPSAVSRMCHSLLVNGGFRKPSNGRLIIRNKLRWSKSCVDCLPERTLSLWAHKLVDKIEIAITLPSWPVLPNGFLLSPVREEVSLFCHAGHYLCHVFPLGWCLWGIGPCHACQNSAPGLSCCCREEGL